MLCVFRDGDLSMAKLQQMANVMFDEKRMLRSTRGAWGKGNQVWVTKQLQSLLKKDGLPVIPYFWGSPEYEGPINFGNSTDLYMDPLNQRNYGDAAYTVLRFYTFDAALPKMDEVKVGYILALFKRVVNVLQPVYAAIGHDEDYMKARKGKDILKFAWGGMVFGPELVEQIGRDRILGSEQLLVKEELAWGGIWTQAWANPFVVSKEWMRLAEQELGLKKLEFPNGKALASQKIR